MLSKKELGIRIKKAREAKAQTLPGKKFTQKQLAKLISISRSYLGDYETGIKYPNYAKLCQIAEICEVSLSFFGDEYDIKEVLGNNTIVKTKTRDIDLSFMDQEIVDWIKDPSNYITIELMHTTYKTIKSN